MSPLTVEQLLRAEASPWFWMVMGSDEPSQASETTTSQSGKFFQSIVVRLAVRVKTGSGEFSPAKAVEAAARAGRMYLVTTILSKQ